MNNTSFCYLSYDLSVWNFGIKFLFFLLNTNKMYNIYMHFLQNRSIELARGLRFFLSFFFNRLAFLIVPKAQTNEFCIF